MGGGGGASAPLHISPHPACPHPAHSLPAYVQASYEEQLLQEKWGAEYEEYQQQTRKLLPYIY